MEVIPHLLPQLEQLRVVANVSSQLSGNGAGVPAGTIRRFHGEIRAGLPKDLFVSVDRYCQRDALKAGLLIVRVYALACHLPALQQRIVNGCLPRSAAWRGGAIRVFFKDGPFSDYTVLASNIPVGWSSNTVHDVLLHGGYAAKEIHPFVDPEESWVTTGEFIITMPAGAPPPPKLLNFHSPLVPGGVVQLRFTRTTKTGFTRPHASHGYRVRPFLKSST